MIRSQNYQLSTTLENCISNMKPSIAMCPQIMSWSSRRETESHFFTQCKVSTFSEQSYQRYWEAKYKDYFLMLCIKYNLKQVKETSQ